MENAMNEYWITNISKQDINLSDLGLTLKAFSTVNLLDKKHYFYTLEEILNSVISGSISKRKSKILIREKSPIINVNNMLIDKDSVIPSRERSLYSIKEENYEELNVSDEKFAEENADNAELDVQPIIVKG
jgi:hypothetical protein